MNERHTAHVAGLVTALAAFGSLCTIAAAQPVPPPQPPAGNAPVRPPTGSVPPPPGAPGAMAPRPPDNVSGPPPLRGIVVTVRPYHVQIRTRNGRYVNLNLRNGTIINPLGLTLTPGMSVAVRGVPGRNDTVATDEIDLRVEPPGLPISRPAGPAEPRPPAPANGAAPPAIPAPAGQAVAPPPPPPQR